MHGGPKIAALIRRVLRSSPWRRTRERDLCGPAVAVAALMTTRPGTTSMPVWTLGGVGPAAHPTVSRGR